MVNKRAESLKTFTFLSTELWSEFKKTKASKRASMFENVISHYHTEVFCDCLSRWYRSILAKHDWNGTYVCKINHKK